MKPKYRLQPIIDARDRAKQEAARVVALRREQLTSAEARLLHCQKAVEVCRSQQTEARSRMINEAEVGTEVHRMVAYRTHLTDLYGKERELIADVERQRAIVTHAEVELDNALAILIEASKELQVIEKHKQHWQERRKRQMEKREQKINDEVGAILYEKSERRSN